MNIFNQSIPGSTGALQDRSSPIFKLLKREFRCCNLIIMGDKKSRKFFTTSYLKLSFRNILQLISNRMLTADR